MLRQLVIVLAVLWYVPSAFGGELPPLRAVDAVTGLKMGYQLVVEDLNRDGRKDLIVIDERGTELAWYENPQWRRHVLAADVPRAINLDCVDLDADGIPEIALAYRFESNPERSIGTVVLLTSGPDPREPWTVRKIDQVPTAHRVRWIRLARNHPVTLLVAPMVGEKSRPPDYKDRAPIYEYKPGEWMRRTVSQELRGILHSIAPVAWDGRPRLLTASFDGLSLLEPARSSQWKRHAIAVGDTRACPRCGSSEVKVGHIGKRRFLAAIEPWHGNQLVVYREQGKRWERAVLDDTMINGHALAVGDLDGDGADEIVAGFRGKGFRVTVYQAQDANGQRWTPHVLDDGGVAAADCKIEDLNGDQRPDIACSGASTGNVRVYLTGKER